MIKRHKLKYRVKCKNNLAASQQQVVAQLDPLCMCIIGCHESTVEQSALLPAAQMRSCCHFGLVLTTFATFAMITEWRCTTDRSHLRYFIVFDTFFFSCFNIIIIISLDSTAVWLHRKCILWHFLLFAINDYNFPLSIVKWFNFTFSRFYSETAGFCERMREWQFSRETLFRKIALNPKKCRCWWRFSQVIDIFTTFTLYRQSSRRVYAKKPSDTHFNFTRGINFVYASELFIWQPKPR